MERNEGDRPPLPPDWLEMLADMLQPGTDDAPPAVDEDDPVARWMAWKVDQ